MGTKSRDTIFGPSIRASADRAAAARKEADRLACEAWNKRMLGYRGPAQPSPTLGEALNAGCLYLEVRCLGCDTHQTVALDIVRRLKTTPIAAQTYEGTYSNLLKRLCRPCAILRQTAIGQKTDQAPRQQISAQARCSRYVESLVTARASRIARSSEAKHRDCGGRARCLRIGCSRAARRRSRSDMVSVRCCG